MSIKLFDLESNDFSEKLSLHQRELKELQVKELEILRELKRLCKENHLCYYLTAGTLLGAVRHKGFIPWDDDIDIAMPRKDFDRLSALCATELRKGFYYQDSEVENNFPYYFAKIRRDDMEVYEPSFAHVKIRKGVFIDIFPLDNCPSSPIKAKAFFKFIELFTSVYQGKVDPCYKCGYTKRRSRFAYSLLNWFSKSTLRKLRNLTRRISAVCGRNGLLCTVGGAHGYPAETYDPTWFHETVMLPFEGEEFPAPAGWHEMLTNMYGDYMTPPDESERQSHFEKIGV